MRKIIINKNDAGQRLDKFMAKMFKTMPSALLYKYIRLKCVRINGVQTKDAGKFLYEGDEVSFYIKDEFFDKSSDVKVDLKGIKPNFKVVYEDENILIVDKPAGLICQPDINESRNTLVNHIKAYLMAKNEFFPERENSFAPALCNRIDKNTQGLVLAAKNAEALKIMNEKVKTREIKKYYECLVFGELKPSKAVLKAYLKKDGDENMVEISDTPDSKEKGKFKEIVTAYEVMKTDGVISWLRIEP
jgi:23S rRNA pseudouridine955/2504/2580 synthase